MQLSLQLDLPSTRPLVPLEALMAFSEFGEDELLEFIDVGRLAWAWDIRTPGADRREIRVWQQCAIELLKWNVTNRLEPGGRVRQVAAQLSQEQVVQRLLPHSRPALRSTETQRMLCCSQTHVSNLIAAGCLCLSEPRTAASGPNSFGRVTRASIIGFLLGRRVL